MVVWGETTPSTSVSTLILRIQTVVALLVSYLFSLICFNAFCHFRWAACSFYYPQYWTKSVARYIFAFICNIIIVLKMMRSAIINIKILWKILFQRLKQGFLPYVSRYSLPLGPTIFAPQTLTLQTLTLWSWRSTWLFSPPISCTGGVAFCKDNFFPCSSETTEHQTHTPLDENSWVMSWHLESRTVHGLYGEYMG